MVVHQLEHVHPPVGAHGQPDEVHDDAGHGKHHGVAGLAPLLGPRVDHDGDDGLQEGELRPEPQGEQHGEEEHGPQLGAGEEGDGLGVDHEGKAGAWGRKGVVLFNVFSKMLRLSMLLSLIVSLYVLVW